jgi:glycosyltransferase involved in cell wall biosynthesis
MKPKRIALATIALGNMPGGLERNIAYLANYLAEAGHEVVLVTFDYPDAKAFYDIDERVTWHRVGRTKPHAAIGFGERLALIGRIRQALFEPRACDAVVCFHHGILARFLLAAVGRRIRVICSERNALTLYNHIRASQWNLNFLLLALADAITVQFPSYVQDYPRFLRRKIAVVHNPVFPPKKTISGVEREPLILSIGRYSSQKRFDLLIDACAKVFAEHGAWRLAIIGDGHLRPELEAKIEKLGLTEKVSLVGPRSDLSQWFARATLYCQPSRWEGFPNAQAEAMAAGVIPIGFAVTRGVADLIDDGINGYLCKGEETAEALARTISTAIVAKGGNRISASAASITETYSVESWRRAWQGVLFCQDLSAANDKMISHATADGGL